MARHIEEIFDKYRSTSGTECVLMIFHRDGNSGYLKIFDKQDAIEWIREDRQKDAGAPRLVLVPVTVRHKDVYTYLKDKYNISDDEILSAKNGNSKPLTPKR